MLYGSDKNLTDVSAERNHMLIYDVNYVTFFETILREKGVDLSDKNYKIYTIDDYILHLVDNGILEKTLDGKNVQGFFRELVVGEAPANCISGIYKGCDYVIVLQ